MTTTPETPIPHLPQRGDEFEQWLKKQRDIATSWSAWHALDDALDRYRLHADTGVPLGQHVCEGGNPDDCAGCHQAAQQPGTAAAAWAAPADIAIEWGVRTHTGYVIPHPTRPDKPLYRGQTLVSRAVARGSWTEVETTR